MKKGNMFHAMLLATAVILVVAGCHSNTGSPKDLLNRYFTAAIRKDYAAAYLCYYDAYKAKISKEDYIRHRTDASVLEAYWVKSVVERGNTAQAEVVLTFEPSQKLKRDHPISTSVTEEMIKENGQWKIKVW